MEKTSGEKVIDKLIKKIKLEDYDIERKKDEARFWIVEGQRDTIDERYFIYDCSIYDCKFEFEKYKTYMKDEDGIAYPIMIFKNWEKEWDIRQSAYEKLTKANDRKLLMEYFEKKQSIYTETKEYIELDVDEDGQNYLEYAPILNREEKRFLGRVYNITFSQLKDLFNITGKDLFSRNVRNGLGNNKTGNEIKQKFKEYIKLGAYAEWISDGNKDGYQIKAIFGIKEEWNLHIPETFWFYHNGITIYNFGEENINFSGRHIKFNPENVSVINGAQTITNYFEGVKELPAEFEEEVKEFKEELQEISQNTKELLDFFNMYLKNVSAKISVKTIFIDGEEKFVQPITYGLNTQIPIIEADRIANSEDVMKINEKLKTGHMKIIKAGETVGLGIGFTVFEFAKKYLIIKRQPGSSKNMQRNKIKEIIEEAERKMQSNNKIIEELLCINIIEEWWKDTQKERNELYEEKYKDYLRYGKIYFEAYVLCERTQELDDSYLLILFEKYLNDFSKIELDVDMRTFKSDELFNKYNEGNNSKKLHKSKKVSFDESDYKEMVDYLNGKAGSHYAVQKTIMTYLNQTKRALEYFRVIARSYNKKNESLVKEAFPFPTSTFSELYQNKTEQNKYKSFDDSKFSDEVSKKVPVFVIDWDESEKGRVAKKIHYIPEFSLDKYKEKAREVYNKTVKAFRDGDESEFPKVSNHKGFHIRPKASNAQDTFEFTNGKQITKRTFWANKSTMNNLLNEYLNVDETNPSDDLEAQGA